MEKDNKKTDTPVKRKVGHGNFKISKSSKRPTDLTTQINSKTHKVVNKAKLISEASDYIGDIKLNQLAKRIVAEWKYLVDLITGMLESLNWDMYSESFLVFGAGSSPLLLEMILLGMLGFLFPIGDHDIIITGSDEDFQMCSCMALSITASGLEFPAQKSRKRTVIQGARQSLYQL